MEEEAEKLKELQNEVEKQMNLSPPPGEFVGGKSNEVPRRMSSNANWMFYFTEVSREQM